MDDTGRLEPADAPVQGELHPRSIAADAPAIEAASIMDAHKLNQMLVLDGDGLLLGALHMHDLLAAKVI